MSDRALTDIADTPKGQRYEKLKSIGRLMDYHRFLEEEAFQQGRGMAERWKAINPRFIAGFWPLLDSWFSRGMSRGLGGEVRSWCFSGVEYYHGSDQTQAMAEYFERRMPQARYLAGFYPPFAYSEDQLEHHVAQATREVGGYWMLGAHKELMQEGHQRALRRAYEKGAVQLDTDAEAVTLRYRLNEERSEGAELVVTAVGEDLGNAPAPQLSLWTAEGGRPCA